MRKFEIYVYEQLGASASCLQLLSRLVENWTLRTGTVRASLSGQRLTGEPCTALGNLIVNMTINA